VGEAGMREQIFLKNKVREAHALLDKLLMENQHLKDDNQFLRKLLWLEMTGKKEEGEEGEVDAMELN
jgi:hypothetical protein